MSSKNIYPIPIPLPPAKINYAGFWIRFFAYSFDVSITYLIASGLTRLFFLIFPGWTHSLSFILSNIFRLFYFVFSWIKYSATPGQMLFGLRVNKITNSKESLRKGLVFSTAIIRYLSSIISGTILFLGYFWVAFDDKKQGWHDKIAKTIVIRLDNKNRTSIKILVIILSIIEYTVIYLSLKQFKVPLTFKSVFFGVR